MIPGEIEQGIEYSDYKDRFPAEYKKIYEESQENLIPISQSLKRNNKPIQAQKENQKIVPLTELTKGNDLNINIKPDFSIQENNAFVTPNNMFTNETPGNKEQEGSHIRNSRNRRRFDLTNPIIENEEEGKGTIEFKNRGRLKEEVKRPTFVSYREERPDFLNDSSQPMIKEDNEESKHANLNDESLDNALRMINEAENQQIKPIKMIYWEKDEKQESSEDNSDEEEKEPPIKDNINLDPIDRIESRRSISAKEPVRMTKLSYSSSSRPQVALKGNLNVKQNALFRENQAPELIIQPQDEEDIDEIINDFSQDLELRRNHPS